MNPGPTAAGPTNLQWRPEMSTTHTSGAQPRTKVSAGKLAIAWALVGIPLAYGVFQTLTRVAALFG